MATFSFVLFCVLFPTVPFLTWLYLRRKNIGVFGKFTANSDLRDFRMLVPREFDDELNIVAARLGYKWEDRAMAVSYGVRLLKLYFDLSAPGEKWCIYVVNGEHPVREMLEQAQWGCARLDIARVNERAAEENVE